MFENDDMDLYLGKENDKGQYLYKGEWLGYQTREETINVCTKPIKMGKLNILINLPIYIICSAQNIAPNNTRASPFLIVAS